MPAREAAARIDRLWAGMNSSWLDLAVQQDCTAMADCPSLRAWQEGRQAESIRLLLSPDYMENMRYFITVSRAKKAAGVDLMRIYLVDERRQQQDAGCRMYLSWLQEHFRQVNIPWGGE